MPAQELIDALSSAESLWLLGLKEFKRHVSPSQLRTLYDRTEIKLLSPHDVVAVAWTYRTSGNLILNIHPDSLQWYEPEQLDLILFAACASHLWLDDPTPGSMALRPVYNRRAVDPELLRLARRIGCVVSDCLHPSERWRLLGVQGVTPCNNQFPHLCSVCERPVNSDESSPLSHANCRVYAKSVIIPQLKEVARAERILAAAELDK